MADFLDGVDCSVIDWQVGLLAGRGEWLEAAARASNRRWLVNGGVASLLVGLDQLTKWGACWLLSSQAAVNVVSVLSLQLVYNTGAAYGVLAGQRWLLLGVGAVTLAIFVRYYTWMVTSVLARIAWILVISGAIGNSIDRLAWGYVIDFVDTGIVPVFNVADMYIHAGVMLWLFDGAWGFRYWKR